MSEGKLKSSIEVDVKFDSRRAAAAVQEAVRNSMPTHTVDMAELLKSAPMILARAIEAGIKAGCVVDLAAPKLEMSRDLSAEETDSLIRSVNRYRDGAAARGVRLWDEFDGEVRASPGSVGGHTHMWINSDAKIGNHQSYGCTACGLLATEEYARMNGVFVDLPKDDCERTTGVTEGEAAQKIIDDADAKGEKIYLLAVHHKDGGFVDELSAATREQVIKHLAAPDGEFANVNLKLRYMPTLDFNEPDADLFSSHDSELADEVDSIDARLFTGCDFVGNDGDLPYTPATNRRELRRFLTRWLKKLDEEDALAQSMDEG